MPEEEDSDDDLINESLFERYDQMFAHYNAFGAMFQETAHYIGLLIRKNMSLHRELDDSEEALSAMQKRLKDAETSNENALKTVTERERQIEDLQGETESLRLQMEQLMQAQPKIKPTKQAPIIPLLTQRNLQVLETRQNSKEEAKL